MQRYSMPRKIASWATLAGRCSSHRRTRRLEFRCTYVAFLAGGGDQADLDYVRILHLAASDGEQTVRAIVARLLAAGAAPTCEAVRAEVRGARTPEGVPFLNILAPDLTVYDHLLGASVR
jgi:hypothetical protein